MIQPNVHDNKVSHIFILSNSGFQYFYGYDPKSPHNNLLRLTWFHFYLSILKKLNFACYFILLSL